MVPVRGMLVRANFCIVYAIVLVDWYLRFRHLFFLGSTGLERGLLDFGQEVPEVIGGNFRAIVVKDNLFGDLFDFVLRWLVLRLFPVGLIAHSLRRKLIVRSMWGIGQNGLAVLSLEVQKLVEPLLLWDFVQDLGVGLGLGAFLSRVV